MDGVVNINKPSGMTSHDVVLRVRRILGEKRIGHAGTLDPLATGVLVLLVGRATRIAQYIEAGEKEYRAVMRLGTTTDTLDAEGRVLETRTYAPPAREEILRVMRGFTGEILQCPPAYSAVKVAGVASYRLARQGRAKPNKPRPVTVREITLTAYEDPLVSLSVRCSKGVYIRSLCADIGDALGPGAHLVSLERTRSGRFTIEQAVTLEALQDVAGAGNAESAIMPVDQALADFPSLSITEDEAGRIAHGGRIPRISQDAAVRAGPVRLHDPSGRLAALARFENDVVRPELVFPAINE
jgi:tRNA pseudouridine55 synthase